MAEGSELGTPQRRRSIDYESELNYEQLEVVMAPDEPAAAGELEARELMGKLEISADDLVDGSYIDLLVSRERRGRL